ncbi:MAG: alpha/beta fold hydrolase [Nodosilinea sp.]
MATSPLAPLPLRTGRLRLPQGTVFWHEAGSGETLVFLHGSWDDSTQWLAVIQPLAAGWHCLAPDLLGFGESSRPKVAYSVALEVDYLRQFLATLRITRCVLVAHSLGAWVALRYALSYPEQVQGLVLLEPEGVATAAERGRWRQDRWLAARFSPLPGLITLLAPILSVLGHKPRLRELRRRRQRLRRAPAACRILFQRRWADIEAERVRLPLPRANLPILVLAAAPDPEANQLTQTFLQGQPEAQHHRLPTAPTHLGVEAPAVAAAMQHWLTEVDPLP